MDMALIAEKIFLLSKSLASPPVIGFIASNSGEGTTFVLERASRAASNVHGKKILVVDMCHNKGFTKNLKLEASRGIRDVSAGRAKVNDVICKTACDGLFVIPAGESSLPVTTEGLKSVVSDCATEMDAIFLDLPPVLSSVTAFEQSQVIDGLIMIVAAHRTRRETVMRARNELSLHAKTTILGCVLNRRRFIIPQALYDII